MKTFILLALFAYAYAVELQHVPKIKVTKVVQHVQQAGVDKVDMVPIPLADHHIPKNVQAIVDNVHQHIPQVIHDHHIAKEKHSQVVAGQQVHQQVDVQVASVVDGKVSQVVGQVPSVVLQAPHLVGNKVQVPHQVQQVVDNVHQHIPEVINQHISSQKVPQVKPVVGKV